VDDACHVAERVRAGLARFPWRAIGVMEGRVTVSCGVAERRPGEMPAAWLERADRAMYKAKGEGRDRVVVADPPSDPTAG
jgi:diguanylate cyclase (GGDEF)-like protein